MEKILLSEIKKIDSELFLKSLFKKNKVSFEIGFEADFKNTILLRNMIGSISDILGLTPKHRSRMIIITDEMNNNSIEYGSLENEINKLRLNIEIKKSTIYINMEVEDTGNGPHHKTAEIMDELKSSCKEDFTDHKGIRGRGLFQIISRIVDSLYFKNSKTGGLIVGLKKTFTAGVDYDV